MPTLSHLISFNNQKNTAYTLHLPSKYRINTQYIVFTYFYLAVKDSAKSYLFRCFKCLTRLHRVSPQTCQQRLWINAAGARFCGETVARSVAVPGRSAFLKAKAALPLWRKGGLLAENSGMVTGAPCKCWINLLPHP
jgi:hypothetical protein